MNISTDYILIGQGLAGSVLADYLMRNNKQILVVDENLPHTSSKIAAGIINPIVFKRLTLSWKVNTLLPEAQAYYKQIESEAGKKILYSTTIYRIFANQAEFDFWRQQCNEPHLVDYLSEPEKADFNSGFHSPFGYGKVWQAGFLDTISYIGIIQEKLKKNNSFLCEKFDFKRLKVDKSGITYGNIRARKIIFCRGWQDASNPFFESLNIFKLTKGEVLTVLPQQDIDFSQEVSKGVFFLKHLSDYKIGATYRWDTFDTVPTPDAKTELLQKFNGFARFNVTIVSQLAGVRPTVKDRRPVIGFLQTHPHIGIFNGLGTKGVMIAPWLASQMLRIMEQQPVEREINLQRFE